ncbi:MAG: hypothetical protein AAGD05_19310, partial [Bacteroidota bacterium]
MMVTYEQLLQLNFQHQYDPKGNVMDYFQVDAPSSNASVKMGVRSKGEGVMVYYAKPAAAVELPQPVSVCLPIWILNNEFYNFTDLDFQPGKIWYFSNELAKTAVLNTDEALSLPLLSSRLSYPMSIEKQRELTGIKLLSTVGTEETLPLPTAPYPTDYLLDLTGTPTGKYTLQFEFGSGHPSENYAFFLSDEWSANPPLAVFQWKGVINETSASQLTYTMAFNARSVYWKYWLIGLSDQEWQNTVIETKMGATPPNILFEKAKTKEQLANGQTAFTATSVAPIPLQLHPEWTIHLITQQMPEGMQLPYLQANSLSSGKTGDDVEGLFANGYIYI